MKCVRERYFGRDVRSGAVRGTIWGVPKMHVFMKRQMDLFTAFVFFSSRAPLCEPLPFIFSVGKAGSTAERADVACGATEHVLLYSNVLETVPTGMGGCRSQWNRTMEMSEPFALVCFGSGFLSSSTGL